MEKELQQDQKYIFGMADITWGEEAIPVQGDAATLNITPEYIDVVSYEMGAVQDKIIKSYNVTLEAVFEEDSARIFQMAVPLTAEEGNTGAFMDSALGESLRAKAKELVIHPRSAGEAEDLDVTLFKAISTGSYERKYGLEQGKIAVTFTALVKDGATPGKIGNIFRIGPKPTV